jgi:hypothetical protein
MEMADPVTKLHYAPNSNVVNGVYAPGADGFNLADISSAAEAETLPAGVLGLVWLGDTSGVTPSFMSTVNAAVGDPKVYGFFLADEPGPDVSAANLKAEADYIHSVDPGAITFITLYNNGTPTNPSYSFNSANTDIDLFGLDPYPVRPWFTNGVDYSVIGDAVNAAEAEGIPQSALVPVYQAFGGGQYTSYTLPTPAQEQTILSTWGQYLPNPAFDMAYSWGIQDGDTALVDDPSLQAVLAAHNAGTGTPPPPADVLTSQATTIDATAGQTFLGTVATFTDSNASIPASGLTATINWGDGTATTAGVVTGGNGSFTVAGSHTYSTAGSDSVAVALTENPPNTATATAESTANVSSPPPPPPPPNDTTMTATSNGVTANVPVITSDSSGTDVGSGLVSQTVSSGVDTFSFTNITSETVHVGSGNVSMRFLSPGALTLTGGSGTDNISANSGKNAFTAGTGTLDVTGGSGRDSYVFHSGDDLLKIEDFSKQRDSLTVDKSLQGAFQETSDGHGGVMLTFGTSGQGVDLVGVSYLAKSTIHFV